MHPHAGHNLCHDCFLFLSLFCFSSYQYYIVCKFHYMTIEYEYPIAYSIDTNDTPTEIVCLYYGTTY